MVENAQTLRIAGLAPSLVRYEDVREMVHILFVQNPDLALCHSLVGGTIYDRQTPHYEGSTHASRVSSP